MKSRKFNIQFQFFTIILFSFIYLISCNPSVKPVSKTRSMVDTIGFAQYAWQMDSVIARIENQFDNSIQNMLSGSGISEGKSWKVAISPHDDYSYAGILYPVALKNIKAKTLIIFGVAHKARLFNLENQLIFDSFDEWNGPYGNIKVSSVREKIIKELPSHMYQVNDSMQTIEHSVEALIPFLQHQNKEIEIVSILVPYMSFDQMNKIAIPLSEALNKVVKQNNWEWGKDIAFVISNDAVHYGDDGWGGKNFARYGADSIGYQLAIQHENKIIQTISGELTSDKIQSFCSYTVMEDDFKEYKWTWCGRYSVPFGLLTAFHFNQLNNDKPLVGTRLGYASSIDHEMIIFDDIGMGVTAPANIRHWVGYAAIGYR